MRNPTIHCVVLISLLYNGNPSFGDEESIGSDGINSAGLKLPDDEDLTGAGIGIGQVEGFRPGRPTANGGPDNTSNSAVETVPEQVYKGSAISSSNGDFVQGHAQSVAGIMISSDSRAPGVAPGALLHSGASGASGQRDYARTANLIATRTTSLGGEIHAINMSFGLALDGGETLAEGDAHLTSFVDWSAATHDVLYVVGGRESPGGDGPVPNDNYNGITVAGSSDVLGRYGPIASYNLYTDDAGGGLDDRVSVDLLAPGVNIGVVTLGNNLSDPEFGGTSAAAPHVTGAVALLQEYAKFQRNVPAPNWGDNSQRHEVMKALLLNSADKLVGVHNSFRTIFNLNSQSWKDTPAYTNPNMPLDLNFGAGHVNVESALINFSPGEHAPGTVPLVGWDYEFIGGQGSHLDYTLSSTIEGLSTVAVTLAWDRIVQLTDPDGTYDADDTFFNNTIESELTNLDVYLMPASSNDINTAIAKSTAPADSVEHIFFELEENQGGSYKIRVVNNGGGSGEGQDFAISWWADEGGEPISGDFNKDGMVDGTDLAQWQGDFGVNDDSDDNGDGVTDGADFLAWQRNFGFGVPVMPASATVPEPAACLLLMLGLPMLRRRR